MDFMTSLAYWGMAALVIINGIIVLRMKIDVLANSYTAKSS